jgi:hypothetical protein
VAVAVEDIAQQGGPRTIDTDDEARSEALPATLYVLDDGALPYWRGLD